MLPRSGLLLPRLTANPKANAEALGVSIGSALRVIVLTMLDLGKPRGPIADLCGGRSGRVTSGDGDPERR